MSFINHINKKNLKLKNISFMSPISHSKLNISNLNSETKRIITNSNGSIINIHQINNKEEKNKLLNEVFKNYSTNKEFNFIQSKKPHINLNYISNNQILNDINSKNIYKKTSTSPSTNSMIKTFTNFPTTFHKNNQSNIYLSNSNYKNLINLKNSSQISSRNGKHKKNSSSLINNSSLNNFNSTQNKDNVLLLSSNNTNNQILNLNSSQFQKYNSNTDVLNKKKNDNYNINNNIKTHHQNFSCDFVNNFNSPLSASTSTNNIGKNYYNEIFNRFNYKNISNLDSNNINDNINYINNNCQKDGSQNLFNSIKENNNDKKLFKCSLNSNSCNSNNYNELYNIKNVESPEELHFYYINVIQNGKNLEDKFDLSNSIHN